MKNQVKTGCESADSFLSARPPDFTLLKNGWTRTHPFGPFAIPKARHTTPRGFYCPRILTPYPTTSNPQEIQRKPPHIMSKSIAKNENEKTIGIELAKTINALNESREESVEAMAKTISLAADAGDLILSAEVEGLNLPEILRVGGVSEEQARRLKRVAGARPQLNDPEPGTLKQLCLWSGILPDPIENSTPRPPKAWHSYLVAASQWVARKRPAEWNDEQKDEFMREAKPIVDAYNEIVSGNS